MTGGGPSNDIDYDMNASTSQPTDVSTITPKEYSPDKSPIYRVPMMRTGELVDDSRPSKNPKSALTLVQDDDLYTTVMPDDPTTTEAPAFRSRMKKFKIDKIFDNEFDMIDKKHSLYQALDPIDDDERFYRVSMR